MQQQLTSDQEFFRDTTARFLDEHASVAAVRALRDDPAGFDPERWRRGADLGWTSLLVGEDHGGGSVSGRGLVDLGLVAYEFGRRAAPGPLLTTNVVAGALSAAGAHPELLAGLLDGSAIASWCHAEPPPHGRLGDLGLQIRVEGGDVVLDGLKRPVEAAGSATHLLVTGRTGEGITQVVVPVDTPGVTVTPLRSVDLTRRFGAVHFDGVRIAADAVLGQVGKAGEDVERQLQQALVVLAAESVGAMETAFEMTLEWSFDRYSFGRPLASYQALKHRFAHMKSWLEAGHALVDEAAEAVADGAPGAAKAASAAKAFVGEHGSELVQDCVQLHGGIGVTYEHDIHLYVRRHTVDRSLHGTPGEHRLRIVDLMEREEQAS
jgi:alkylation response protein AidB-like acyl-CoA dehydrogenase